MFAAPEYLIGIPLTGIVFGVVAYFWAGYKAREFDRRYGRPPAPGE